MQKKKRPKFRHQPIKVYENTDELIALRYASEKRPWTHFFDDVDKIHELGFTGKGVKIGFLDTGIDKHHRDFVSVLKGVYDYFRRDETSKYYGQDDNGHGTMSGGVVAANANNEDVVGVAPDVDLRSYTVLMNGSGSRTSVLTGLKKAVADGNQVIIGSIGMYEHDEKIAKYIKKVRLEKGIRFVFANGNDSDQKPQNFPANLPDVIGAGSCNRHNDQSVFSNRGKFPCFFAGGEKILTTKLGGGTVFFDGTSAVAPFIGGLLALLIEAQVPFTFQTLEDYGRPTNIGNIETGLPYKRIDAYRMILELSPILKERKDNQEEPEDPDPDNDNDHDCSDKEKVTQNLIQSILSFIKTWFK